MRIFDKIGYAATSAFLSTTSAFAIAPSDNVDLSGKLDEMNAALDTASDKGFGIVTIILTIVGLVAFVYGVYETFIDEDARQEGKKVKGVLKMIGGVLLAFGAFIFKSAIQ